MRGAAEFYVPLHPAGDCDLRRSCHSLVGIARLRDGVTVAMAQANTAAIAKQLEQQYPGSNRGQGASVISLSEQIIGDIRPILLVLLAGAALLLLIACINVSSLLLVRSESRKREIAVRAALGASRARLIRQFITEGLLLVSIAALLGLAAAAACTCLLLHLISKDMLLTVPYLRGLGINAHVLPFAGTVCLLAVVLFSLTPVARIRWAQIREGLNDGGRGAAGTLWRRMGANLVILELATARVLLAGAGLLGKSFYRLLHVNLGFERDHLATLAVSLADTSYKTDAQRVTFDKTDARNRRSHGARRTASECLSHGVEGGGMVDPARHQRRPGLFHRHQFADGQGTVRREGVGWRDANDRRVRARPCCRLRQLLSCAQGRIGESGGGTASGMTWFIATANEARPARRRQPGCPA